MHTRVATMQGVTTQALTEVLKGLYSNPPTKDKVTNVISQFMTLYRNKVRIVQWGNKSIKNINNYENHINQLHAYYRESELENVTYASGNGKPDCDSFENYRSMIFPNRAAKGNNSISINPGAYVSDREYVTAPLNQHGENSFDIAIIDTDYCAADCIEISKLLVVDGGIIFMSNIESWHPSDSDDVKRRDIREVISSFNEYYFVDRRSSVIIVNRKSTQPYCSFATFREKSQLLNKSFNALQDANVLFLVLRSADFIPANCSDGKDIDIIVHPSDIKKTIDTLSKLGYRHYRDRKTNNSHLYNSQPNDHFLDSKRDIHIDVVQGLYYSSLSNSTKVPVYSRLQKTIFERRRYVPYPWKCIPDINDMFIHILCREIYDKKKITPLYKELLDRLFRYSNKQTIEDELKNVFFSFTPVLLKYFEEGQSDDLFIKYIRFTNY